MKIPSGLVAWVCFDLWGGFVSCVRNQNKSLLFLSEKMWKKSTKSNIYQVNESVKVPQGFEDV